MERLEELKNKTFRNEELYIGLIATTISDNFRFNRRLHLLNEKVILINNFVSLHDMACYTNVKTGEFINYAYGGGCFTPGYEYQSSNEDKFVVKTYDMKLYFPDKKIFTYDELIDAYNRINGVGNNKIEIDNDGINDETLNERKGLTSDQYASIIEAFSKFDGKQK